MLFNSLEFIIFFPIVFALYWMARRNANLQNLVLIAASCVFYAWVDWRFLFLIGFTAIIMYPPTFKQQAYNVSLKSIRYISKCLSQVGFHFICSPKECTFTKDNFYDTNYHLNHLGHCCIIHI